MTSQVIARRIGRIAFGLSLLAGAAWLGASTFAQETGGRQFTDAHPWLGVEAWNVLRLAWAAALVFGVGAWAVARRIRWDRNPDYLFARSIYTPAAGLALTLPLSLHMLLFLLAGSAHEFNDWCWMSAIITGPAHLVLALMLVRRGRLLVAGKPAPTPRHIYVTTIVVSCLPFIIIYLIPPLIVAITGVPFLWIARHMKTIVERERDELAHAPHVPPRAVVI